MATPIQVVQEIEPAKLADIPLADVPGVVTWGSVADATAVTYSIRTGLPGRQHEWGIGTKVTTAGKAYLHRTAGGVSAGNGGSGALVNFSCAAELTLSVPGSAPVGQQNTTGTTQQTAAGAGAAIKADSTTTGGVGSTAYTFADVVRALKNDGLLAS
jgi:hypothetical protein